MRSASHPWKVLLATLFAAAGLLFGGSPDAFAQNGYYSSYDDVSPDSSALLLDSARVVAEAAPAQALVLLNRALEAAITHRNHSAEARAYLATAEIQERLGRLPEAKASLLLCKGLFEQRAATTNFYSQPKYSKPPKNRPKPKNDPNAPDPSILRDASVALTRVLEAAEDLPTALQESAFGLELLRVSGSKAAVNTMLRTQARLHSKMGQHALALSELQSLLAGEQIDGDQNGACATLIELGEHYQRIGDNEMAKAQFTKAIAIAKERQFNEKNILASRFLANIYKAEGNLQEEVNVRNAVVNLSFFSPVAPQNNFTENIAIGNAYLQANQPHLAEQYLATGMANLTSNQPAVTVTTDATSTLCSSEITTLNSVNLQAGADAYLWLAESYGEKNELQKSLEFYKKYATLQDSVKVVHARELEDAMNLSKTLGKNEERLQLLERERTLSDKSIEVLQQDQALKGSQILTRNLIIGVLVACIVLGIVVGFVLARNTRARRRADKLLALNSMTGQMNPHFIFNALNSVNEYISQNDERAANRYLSSFSKLMRKVMDDSKHAFIPLSEELEMLRLYLELEHARFKDQFAYTFEVDDALEGADFALPPMIVQPYIENAIWHGLRYRPAGGQLQIKFQAEADVLTITIADDGIGIAQSKAIKTTQQKRQHSMGMQNIGTRMALMNEIYGSGMTVSVTETHPGAAHPGTTVRIVIPQTPKVEHPTA